MGKTRKAYKPFKGTTKLERLRVDEGLVPQPHERGLRTRDRSGQRLRDVIDPKTGFCVGVTGPMESDGTSVRAAKGTSGGGAPLPEYDPSTGLWTLGDQLLVVRTESDGDAPLRKTRLVPRVPASSGAASKAPRIAVDARKPATPRATRVKQKRYTREQVIDWLNRSFGYTGRVSRDMLYAAQGMMARQEENATKQANKQSKGVK